MLDRIEQFKYSELVLNEQFVAILRGIARAHRAMLVDCPVIDNNERRIRNYLYEHYLDNGLFREKHGLNPFIFIPEPAEIKDGEEVGYLDIKVITFDTFRETKNYYTVECKKLDGKYRLLKPKAGSKYLKNSLATEYIENGVFRFVSQQYPTPLGVNGMVGFVVEEVDIEDSITDITSLMQERFTNCKTSRVLEKVLSDDDFEFTFLSTHRDVEENVFDLYHLMLDLSSIVRRKVE